MCEIRLQIVDDKQGRMSEALGEWLAGEQALRGRVRRASLVPEDRTMGAATDAIVVAVGSGGVATALVTSLGTWLATRRGADREVSIRVERPDGTKITISAKGVDDVEATVRTTLAPWLGTGSASEE